MASLTILNTDDIIATLTNKGGNWYAALLFDDGTVIAGETITDLVASIIDDYEFDNTPEGVQAALDARYDFAVESAGLRQAFAAFALNQEGVFDQDVESEETLTTIFSPKDRAIPDDLDSWDHAVPLVLIATDFAPVTSRARPEGNIQWVDPTTELTLLQSLAKLGDFEMWFREEQPAAS